MVLATDRNVILYAANQSFEGDEFDVRVAEIKQDITKLLESGFERVGKDNGLVYFRKSE